MPKEQRGERPSDFVWHSLPQIGTRILKPNSWFTRVLQVPGVSDQFTINITRENMQRGPFRTGISIGAYLSGLDPQKIDLQALQLLAVSYNGLLKDVVYASTKETDELLGVEFSGVRDTAKMLPSFFQQSLPVLEPNLRHYRVEASRLTGYLYVICFESPAGNGKRDQLLGQKMMDSLKINPRVPSKPAF